MPVTVKFCGAAGMVTGSCYLVTHPGGRFLVDCGMFQGSKTLRELNYGAFPFDPTSLDFVILTHAHIDHSGLLPKLYLAGFKGPIYASEATGALLAYVLPDSGHIQESEVNRLNRRNARRGRPSVSAIYTQWDAEAALGHLVPLPFDRWCELGRGLSVRLWNAGHILGAASLEFEITPMANVRSPLRLLFSGDLGPGHKAFEHDPRAPEGLDYLIMESTYGDRARAESEPERRQALLAEEVRAAWAAGGNLLIPAFAIERTQELLYDLTSLFDCGAIPRTNLFLDSPLAIKATGVFQTYLEAPSGGQQKRNPFAGPNIHYVTSVAESKALNRISSGAIIIAGSGMCDAGRIRDHLLHNLWRPEATVLLVGYQAPGTLGSLLLQGVPAVRIRGEEVRVRARIRALDTYSGHASRSDLVRWAKDRFPVRSAIFLTHAEEAARIAMQRALINAGCTRSAVCLPGFDETIELVPNGRPRVLPPEPGSTPRLDRQTLKPTDWHNAYARLLLDFSQTLRKLPGDNEREELINRLQSELVDIPARRHPRRRAG
ncbi:MAG TPA: MBL fold metallo-hydrolase [Alphaproteobacteria bacterium]|nr:MBL fold metallo-hydrolase [Alphaproteobacteria bacterium]